MNIKVSLEKNHRHMLDEARSAFAQVFNDAAYFEKAFGFPSILATDENSPYYILQEAIDQFEEQQNGRVADMDIWTKVFNDIVSAIKNRWDIGEIPFSGTTATLSDSKLLKTMRIEKNDEYLLEYNKEMVVFKIDDFSIDVNKAFGLFCNTSTNDYGHANVYIHWFPNQSPRIVVDYVTYNEERKIPVVLTSEQQKTLRSLLPNMCLLALNRQPEGIWAEAQKKKGKPFDENAKQFDDAIQKIANLGYHVTFADDEKIEFENIPDKDGWQNGFIVSLKTAHVSEYSQNINQPNMKFAGCTSSAFLDEAEVLALC